MKDELRVLQFSTHDEECGIAKYQEQFVSEINKSGEFYTEYFHYSPNVTKKMSDSEFDDVTVELREKLRQFDILHIQHELSFYKHKELKKLITVAHDLDKKVLVTVHTAPAAQYVQPRLSGLGIRSWAAYFKAIVRARRFMGIYFEPIKKADIILVHNHPTKNDLSRHGFANEKIIVVRHPVPNVEGKVLESKEISEKLRTSKNDIIFSTVGFLSENKGILHAVKALQYLPDNYKLAIIGGMHPDSDDHGFYDKVTDLIARLNLQNRVYITGYIQDDSYLNGLIREIDICVYPYDKRYYSYVSSGSLNMAIANHKPVISYATDSFLEINADKEVVVFCKSANYYELAREIKTIDLSKYKKLSLDYANKHAWPKESETLKAIYKKLTVQ